MGSTPHCASAFAPFDARPQQGAQMLERFDFLTQSVKDSLGFREFFDV
jgi:hypothetical protein